MKNLYYCDDVAKIDKISQESYNQPGLILMEQAGLKAWQFIKSKINIDDNILIIAGGGNNGGDSLVVARCAINDGYNNVSIVYCSNKYSETSKIQKKILNSYNLKTYNLNEYDDKYITSVIEKSNVIIDGITAIGLKTKLRDNIINVIEKINKSESIIFSIDVPSGLSDIINNECVKANYTISMGPQKLLYYYHKNIINCGEIYEINPSFPPKVVSEIDEKAYIEDNYEINLKPLNKTDYKKTRGHLAVFGGSEKYPGALILSSKSAFSTRVGLVSAYCDNKIYSIIACESPSIIARKNNEILDLNQYDSLLVGPGWSINRESLLNKILEYNIPLVLDADGIRAYSNLYKKGRIINNKNIIFTPHLGELKLMIDAVLPNQKYDNTLDFIDCLNSLSNKLNSVIVCKASVIYVVAPNKKPLVLKRLNPSLGVAGSGDVLAGCIAAILAKTKDLYYSAIEGAKIHSNAGMLAREDWGFYTSEELIKYIGKQLS